MKLIFIDDKLHVNPESTTQPLEILRNDNYDRFHAAGFSIVSARKYKPHCYSGHIVFHVTFKCVCGQEEEFADMFDDYAPLPEPYDFVSQIMRGSALSVEHLREDGYGEADIIRIRSILFPDKIAA